jgi:predicted nuclease with TOPRIM domain
MESNQLNQFELLSQKVETLLDKFETLAEERDRLRRFLVEKESEIEQLKAKVLTHEQEKVTVTEKVDEVLSRIDQFMTR